MIDDSNNLQTRARNVFDAIGFDYRECHVKGSLSPTWKIRIPAILLSLAQLPPDADIDQIKRAATSERFRSSKETINFFNEHWSDLVPIRVGKKLVSVGNYDDFRDHGIMALVDNGLAIRNTSIVAKNLNGKDTAYRITPEAIGLLLAFDTPAWPVQLEAFNQSRALRIGHAGSARLTVKPSNDSEFTLHEDRHNWLQQKIIEVMLPHFAPSNQLIYAADTEERSTFFNAKLANELEITSIFSEKKPDVVAYDTKQKWIFIVEAVTSTGQISEGRKDFFLRMLGSRRNSAVFVTAFPDRETFRKFAADIAWETEVWLASEAEHMIHFNGERFLGPY